FVLLNPSTADAERDDPTIRKCVGFTRLLGCGSLQVVNLFAYRATNPKDLKRATDPVGPENEEFVRRILEGASGPVICGRGVHGSYRDQDLTVLAWLAEAGIPARVYAVTKGGHPQHPLFVPYSAELMPLPGRKSCEHEGRVIR